MQTDYCRQVRIIRAYRPANTFLIHVRTRAWSSNDSLNRDERVRVYRSTCELTLCYAIRTVQNRSWSPPLNRIIGQTLLSSNVTTSFLNICGAVTWLRDGRPRNLGSISTVSKTVFSPRRFPYRRWGSLRHLQSGTFPGLERLGCKTVFRLQTDTEAWNV
jgi:hypothetical protein